VDDAENEIAGCDVFDDKAQGDEVVDAVDVLVVFGEFFMQRIDGFNAAIAFVFDFFFFDILYNAITTIAVIASTRVVINSTIIPSPSICGFMD
jgi:hypothetical protein